MRWTYSPSIMMIVLTVVSQMFLYRTHKPALRRTRPCGTSCSSKDCTLGHVQSHTRYHDWSCLCSRNH